MLKEDEQYEICKNQHEMQQQNMLSWPYLSTAKCLEMRYTSTHPGVGGKMTNLHMTAINTHTKYTSCCKHFTIIIMTGKVCYNGSLSV